jgi:transcriptional regulator of acetoin/glycerol metabolism
LRFDYASARALLLYEWPGNVRELEKCLASALALAQGTAIELAHLPPAVREAARAAPAAESATPAIALEGADDERQRLLALLGAHEGNLAAVARVMGKDRTQIHRLLRKHGLLTDLAVIRSRK